MAKLRLNDPLTAEYLREALDYDRETGVLTWRRRPREHFGTQRGWSIFNARSSGKPAGSLTKVHGCVQIGLMGRFYLGHRLAWMHVTGAWPTSKIDHRDLAPDNNAWANLREASDSQNQWNQRKQANNTSGFKGVSWHLASSKWWAQIVVKREHHNLGMFDTAEAAHAAYCEAATRLHGEFSRVA